MLDALNFTLPFVASVSHEFRDWICISHSLFPLRWSDEFGSSDILRLRNKNTRPQPPSLACSFISADDDVDDDDDAD